LLRENKLGRYLIYALGEIVLLVIGILIALQINNWNEARKLQDKEFAALAEIQSNLQVSKKRIEEVIKDQKTDIRHFRQLIEHLAEDRAYHPSLDTIFDKVSNWTSPYLTYTAYETLKTVGIDLIKDQDIRDRITDIYEYEFKNITNDWDRYEWERAVAVTFPFVEKHLRKDLETQLSKPNNYEELKQNVEFLNILHSNIGMRRDGIRKYKSVIEKIDSLSYQIENILE